MSDDLIEDGTNNLIIEAIEEHWGERCPDYADGCVCCEAWKQYDALSTAGAAEPVAWRYRGHFNGVALPWQMTDQKWLADRERENGDEVEPLFATPPVAPTGTVGSVKEAATALVQKLKLIHDDPTFQSVWTLSHLHVGPYTGPQYADELAALEAALSAPTVEAPRAD